MCPAFVGTKLVAVGRSLLCGPLSRFGVDTSVPDGLSAKPSLMGEESEVLDEWLCVDGWKSMAVARRPDGFVDSPGEMV